MALFPCKPSGGQGGKLGHSNMAHRTHTSEYKDAAKKHRRTDRSRICRQAVKDEREGT